MPVCMNVSLRTPVGLGRWLALGILAAGLGAGPVAAGQLGDELNAFNGYVMQAPLSQYPSLKLLKTWEAEEVKEVGYYENPGEVLTLNGVTFTRVRYRFADRQLESVYLIYEGRENRDKLVRWLEDHYGRLTPAERRMVNQVEWHGDRLSITLSYNFTSHRGTLWFVSPMLNHLLSDSVASMPD